MKSTKFCLIADVKVEHIFSSFFSGVGMKFTNLCSLIADGKFESPHPPDTLKVYKTRAITEGDCYSVTTYMYKPPRPRNPDLDY